MVKEWLMKIEIPQYGFDETSTFIGSYPWTAFNRASDWALRFICKKMGLVYTGQDYLNDGNPTSGANIYDLRLNKNTDKIEPFSITLMGRVKPKREKRPTMKPAEEKGKPVEGFVPMFGIPVLGAPFKPPQYPKSESLE